MELIDAKLHHLSSFSLSCVLAKKYKMPIFGQEFPRGSFYNVNVCCLIHSPALSVALG